MRDAGDGFWSTQYFLAQKCESRRFYAWNILRTQAVHRRQFSFDPSDLHLFFHHTAAINHAILNFCTRRCFGSIQLSRSYPSNTRCVMRSRIVLLATPSLSPHNGVYLFFSSLVTHIFYLRFRIPSTTAFAPSISFVQPAAVSSVVNHASSALHRAGCSCPGCTGLHAVSTAATNL